jgi:hypothetical protein
LLSETNDPHSSRHQDRNRSGALIASKKVVYKINKRRFEMKKLTTILIFALFILSAAAPAASIGIGK